MGLEPQQHNRPNLSQPRQPIDSFSLAVLNNKTNDKRVEYKCKIIFFQLFPCLGFFVIFYIHGLFENEKNSFKTSRVFDYNKQTS